MFDLTIFPHDFSSLTGTYFCLIVTVIGLVIGSFLNVVALRFLSGESIVFPPSKCPKCETKLKWYDNIPLFSYIVLLRGKCRYCGEHISFQYPVIEFLTAACFLATFIPFGYTLKTLFWWYLISACIVMIITDFKEQVIFDCISMPLIVIGFIYSCLNIAGADTSQVALFNFGIIVSDEMLNSLIGIIIGFVVFEIVSLISKLIIKQRMFGEGDSFIAAAFGAWFGWKILLLGIVLSLLIQTVFTLPLMFFKFCKNKDYDSIKAFSILILCVLLPLVSKYIPFFGTFIGSLLLVIVVMTTAIICVFKIMNKLKETQSFTMLPFGPALIAGCFTAIFLADNIMQLF